VAGSDAPNHLQPKRVDRRRLIRWRLSGALARVPSEEAF